MQIRKYLPLLYSYKRQKLLKLAETYPDFMKLLEEDFDFLKEYKIMMKLMSDKGKFVIHNLKKHIQTDGEDPVTFADIKREGDIDVPVEIHLTHKSDLMSAQSIDYIFHVRVNAHKIGTKV